MKRTLTILAVIMLAGSALGFMKLIGRRRAAAVSGTPQDLSTNPAAFKMTWAIPSTAAVTVPTTAGATYIGMVDWGDGTILPFTAYNSAAFTHAYAGAGSYKISITGIFQRLYFANTGNKSLVTSIDNMGEVGLTYVFRSSWGCNNMTTVNFSNETSDVTGSLLWGWGYDGCSSLTNFDTGLINMALNGNHKQTFRGCSALTSLRLGTNQVNCTTAEQMLYLCTSLTNCNFEDWGFGPKLTTLATFGGGIKVPNIDISSWVVTNVVNTGRLMEGNTGLTNMVLPASGFPKSTTLYHGWSGCTKVKSMQLVDIGANCTAAHDIYDECNVLTGDVSQLTMNSTTLLEWGCQDSDLTYVSSNGFFSANIKNGFTLEFNNCNLPAQQTANILVDLDVSGSWSGTVTVAGNTAPTVDGYLAKTNLIARAWSVTTP